MKKLYSTLSLLAFAASCFSQSTGFLPPTATAAPNNWTNAANAFASDDQWASVTHGSGCRCPWVYLSWDGGTSYTNYHLMGPFGTTDGTQVSGSPTDNWGHTWTYTEFSNSNFRLKIANPSMSIEQGWSDFNFNVPSNATINGIEVKLEWHGDANFTMEFLDQALINVYYTSTTGLESVSGNSAVSIFPNPASDKITLQFSEKPLQISLLNLQGQELIEMPAASSTASCDLDVSALPRGIYFVRVISESGIHNERIILE